MALIRDEGEWLVYVDLLRTKMTKEGQKFLDGIMDEKEKWSLVHDMGGRRCGFITSNRREIFSSLLRGLCALLVTAIVSYTFYKCMEWFVDRLKEANDINLRHE